MGRSCRVVLLVLAGCDAADPPAGPWDPAARALLDEVRADDYESWPELAIEGDAPHGTWSIIYGNPALHAAIDGAPIERWPDGVVVVCEGRAEAEGELTSLQIMTREAGGWTWAQYDADFEPSIYGSEPACAHCHAVGDDYLRSFTLPAE